jgi:hypothetical protein
MSELRQRKGKGAQDEPESGSLDGPEVSGKGDSPKETRSNLAFFMAFLVTAALVGGGALYVNGGLRMGDSIGRLMTTEELAGMSRVEFCISPHGLASDSITWCLSIHATFPSTHY